MGLPVILCGKTERIGVGVIADLKPEFDVIHFVMVPSAGAVQIPRILKGESDIPSDSNLGSRDYSRPPVCVILGGGYDDAGIDEMMAAAKGLRGIPWLRPDLSKPAPPLGPEYGKAMVARIKKLIPELENDGQMNEAKLHYY
ncbi:hypothetical protein S7711_02799 [Stachybotrys chartarum IBT 7711]|uniref:Uncharacterized protein n=1 Tax=Stachybotrys chartarum (strain CBS 109288 / IBT 7711) TaxID=1280523 RepID=A0A084AM11_STACB|nr:hypothetical protein S7711_02799 [Stachybotrys chartarum IBT 7711]KFA49869.1 hypothetical protein S40293_01227 [Stachybotrys chartarum IBT 40293]KFA77684.1 hypothetical protein S40288_02700 [Stachybotrys chartarum IBT 40288]